MNRILILSALFIYPVLTSGQTNNFRKYVNQTYKCSFEIPNYWTIKFSKLQGGFVCIPSTNFQKDIYDDCYDGIVFRLDFYTSNLDSTLLEEGLYTKDGGKYYTSDRIQNGLPCEYVEGKNWNGIYHNNICGISCKGDGFHAAAGQCETIYFSNGQTTICINTNGRQFEDAILKRLIKSFKFN